MSHRSKRFTFRAPVFRSLHVLLVLVIKLTYFDTMADEPRSSSIAGDKFYSQKDGQLRFAEESFNRCCSQISTVICCLLSLFNLVSFAIKLPFIVLIVRMAFEQVYRKLHPTVVPTLEPMYEDEIDPNQVAVAEQITKSAVINGAFFLVTFMCVLVIQFSCFIHFWKRKRLSTSSCKDMSILAFYIFVMTVWLLLSFSSMIIQEWKYYLSLIFLLFKSMIHGNDLFDPPPNYEITLIRIALWLDLGTYVLTVIHLAMSTNGSSGEENDLDDACYCVNALTATDSDECKQWNGNTLQQDERA